MSDGKRVAILISDGFEDDDVTGPARSLRAAGHEVRFVGADLGKTVIGGRNEEAATIDVSLRGADPEAFDALLVPGGEGIEALTEHTELLDLVHDLCTGPHQGRVAARGHGVTVLAAAGGLRGRAVACEPDRIPQIEEAGGRWLNQPIVADDTVLTARRTAPLSRFEARLLEQLDELERASA